MTPTPAAQAKTTVDKALQMCVENLAPKPPNPDWEDFVHNLIAQLYVSVERAINAAYAQGQREGVEIGQKVIQQHRCTWASGCLDETRSGGTVRVGCTDALLSEIASARAEGGACNQ